MRWFLDLVNGPHPGARWVLGGRGSRVVGRTEGDFRIDDPSLSRRHARLFRRGRRWAVEDLDSKNGTRVNGAGATRARALRPGDQIQFGRVLVNVSRGSSSGRWSRVGLAAGLILLGALQLSWIAYQLEPGDGWLHRQVRRAGVWPASGAGDRAVRPRVGEAPDAALPSVEAVSERVAERLRVTLAEAGAARGAEMDRTLARTLASIREQIVELKRASANPELTEAVDRLAERTRRTAQTLEAWRAQAQAPGERPDGEALASLREQLGSVSNRIATLQQTHASWRETLENRLGARSAENFSAEVERVVFVVDASGSLIDTMPFVIDALAERIERLGAEQRAAVIFYQDGAAMEAPPVGMHPVSETTARRVRAFADPGRGNVLPAGTSDPIGAIERAALYEPDEIVLFTDAITNGRTTGLNPARLIEAVQRINGSRSTALRLSAVHLFREDPLGSLRVITRMFGGSYTFVDEPDDYDGPEAESEGLLEALGPPLQ